MGQTRSTGSLFNWEDCKDFSFLLAEINCSPLRTLRLDLHLEENEINGEKMIKTSSSYLYVLLFLQYLSYLWVSKTQRVLCKGTKNDISILSRDNKFSILKVINTYQIVPSFKYAEKESRFENIVGKAENASLRSFKKILHCCLQTLSNT